MRALAVVMCLLMVIGHAGSVGFPGKASPSDLDVHQKNERVAWPLASFGIFLVSTVVSLAGCAWRRAAKVGPETKALESTNPMAHTISMETIKSTAISPDHAYSPREEVEFPLALPESHFEPPGPNARVSDDIESLCASFDGDSLEGDARSRPSAASLSAFNMLELLQKSKEIESEDNKPAKLGPEDVASLAKDGGEQIPADVRNDPMKAVAARASRLNSEIVAKDRSRRRKVPPWKRGHLLGSGSFAQVFLGMNQIDGRMMAVKQILFDSAHQGIFQTLALELEIMKSLSHPNIVQYYGCDIDEIQSTMYIFMEYVNHGSLLTLIQSFGPLEETLARHYVQQILHGLAYLHSKCVVHRDIKTANLLVDSAGKVKLADFGASLYLSVEPTSSLIKGTPLFMPPEMIRNEPVTPKADIWALGCTLIQLLTGELPWANHKFDSVASAFITIGSTNAVPALTLSTITTECLDFFRCCCVREPSRRSSAAACLRHAWFLVHHDDSATFCSTQSKPSAMSQGSSKSRRSSHEVAVDSGSLPRSDSIVSKRGKIDTSSPPSPAVHSGLFVSTSAVNSRDTSRASPSPKLGSVWEGNPAPQNVPENASSMSPSSSLGFGNPAPLIERLSDPAALDVRVPGV